MTQRTELTAAQRRILISANRTEDDHFFVPWPQLRAPGADEKACVNMVSYGLMERWTGFKPSYQITAAGRAALQEDQRQATGG
jgi:hypothetical protein